MLLDKQYVDKQIIRKLERIQQLLGVIAVLLGVLVVDAVGVVTSLILFFLLALVGFLIAAVTATSGEKGARIE